MQRVKTESKRHDGEHHESRSSRAASSESGTAVTPERRAEMIAVAAYFIAERRCFAPGCSEDDWLAAEAEIDRRLAENASVAGVDGRAG